MPPNNLLYCNECGNKTYVDKAIFEDQKARVDCPACGRQLNIPKPKTLLNQVLQGEL